MKVNKGDEKRGTIRWITRVRVKSVFVKEWKKWKERVKRKSKK